MPEKLKPDFISRLKVLQFQLADMGLPVGNFKPFEAASSYGEPSVDLKENWEKQVKALVDELTHNPDYHFFSFNDAQNKVKMEVLLQTCRLTIGVNTDLEKYKKERPNLHFHTFPPTTYETAYTAENRVILSLDDLLQSIQSENDSLFKSSIFKEASDTLKKNIFLSQLAMQGKDVTVFRYGRVDAPYRYGSFPGKKQIHDLAEFSDQPMSWWSVLTPEGLNANPYQNTNGQRKLFITTIGELEKQGHLTADYIDDFAIIFADTQNN